MQPQKAILVAALALAAGSSAQAPSGGQIAAGLTARSLQADVAFLASDAMRGRASGTPELGIAAEFIASQFRRAGLEPAGDDGYFQTASYVRVTPQPGVELTLEIGGQTVKMRNDAFALVNPLAMDRKGTAVKAVQDQVSLQALTPEQVRGKILILEPPEGERPSRTLSLSPAMQADLQPALIILLSSTAELRPLNTMGRLREAAAPEPTPTLVVWDDAIRAALAGKNGVLDGTVAIHIPEPKKETVKLRNVVGVLRGSDAALKDTYVFLTAHYDHLGVRPDGEGDTIYNGANDNASGTACLMEIANALTAAPHRPKRSMVFVALYGEESGLVGSRYYAAHPIFPLAKTVADLNLEQMGRTDETKGPARVGQINATGFDFTGLTGTLSKAGAEFGVRLVKDEKNSDPFFSRSDNQAFADAGVPSHTLSVTYEFPDYHAVGDEWPKLDYDNMAKVAQTVALGAYLVADDAATPKWNVANAKTARYVKAHSALSKSTAH